MRISPNLLAAALIALPASALAQSSAAQPAPDSSASNAAPTSAATPAPAVPATLADLKAGASVYDNAGAIVGTIESVSTTGAVVSTGTARATLPVGSFTKNAQGLVIGATKAQLEAAVAKATAAKSG